MLFTFPIAVSRPLQLYRGSHDTSKRAISHLTEMGAASAQYTEVLVFDPTVSPPASCLPLPRLVSDDKMPSMKGIPKPKKGAEDQGGNLMFNMLTQHELIMMEKYLETNTQLYMRPVR